MQTPQNANSAGVKSPGVIVIPGGGGKSSLVSKFGNLFVDIDSYWDAEGDVESKMIKDWQAARSSGDLHAEKALVDECVLFKAKECERLGTGGRVVLVQIPEQAMIILGSSPVSEKPEIVDDRLLVLSPTSSLHAEALEAKGEPEWVRDICRVQREKVNSHGQVEEYSSWDALAERACAFALKYI
uniref:Uncharacterized protein n=1 Tax=Chromera velia CCMP2878 TaxID=1169474 RepID=A0A0G4FL96_9ALVE|eukprot:Cvel_3483.t1-p1 / transcript=Cvel_3483.t1 / gene=Cvel_3483 / organism=Chromera_velia_CCMP2878 / gene_product=hypothetical protein / transcript_product=hypothetical protein / location=Cvel_scaffold140:108674-109225(+) / protein_length=184 / sequence_SO=supercontig / SO=protein_coding / is_pseudo=false